MAGTIKSPPKLAVLVLAAGKGTRMKSPDIAKVMYDLDGKPMIEYVIELAAQLQPARTLLVVGWQKQSVIDYVRRAFAHVEFVEQNDQRGTGHAVMQAMPALREFEGDLLILSGDVPLLTEKTARALVGYHRATEAVATILTAEPDDPIGYGRIVRNEDGSVKWIIEHRDATEAERAIREINAGIYVFNAQKLFLCLPQLRPDNAQGEYYLTDVFELFWGNQWRVSAVKAVDAVEVMGINDAAQLESARAILHSRPAP